MHHMSINCRRFKPGSSSLIQRYCSEVSFLNFCQQLPSSRPKFSSPPDVPPPPQTAPPPSPLPALQPQVPLPADVGVLEVSSVGHRIGCGCYGVCFLASQGGQACVVKLLNPTGPEALKGQQILGTEARRASRLQHENLVTFLGITIINYQMASVWQARGKDLHAALPQLTRSLRVAVVLQMASLVCYCTRKAHPLWGVHPQDIFIDVDANQVARLTLIDCFQVPNQNAGYPPTLPMMLRQGGPQRAKLLSQVAPAQLARTVNAAVALFFFQEMIGVGKMRMVAENELNVVHAAQETILALFLGHSS